MPLKLKYEINGNEYPLMWVADAQKFITEASSIGLSRFPYSLRHAAGADGWERDHPFEIVITTYRNGIAQQSRSFYFQKGDGFYTTSRLLKGECHFWIYKTYLESNNITLEIYR